mmetsp:Transcript_16593/g.34513  ORF Transcript_16593/g.34513 Transcript_16593/m.34513 type:complete len:430 (-) Transcript_16593:5-1294(-)
MTITSRKIALTLRIWLILLPMKNIIIEALSIGRRKVINKATTSMTGLIFSARPWLLPDPATASNDSADRRNTVNPSYISYQIIPDGSKKLNPTLKPISSSDLSKIFSMAKSKNGGALWLGEHHNSAMDHDLQANFICCVHDERNKGGDPKMAVGLEMVQVQFQPVLDAYVSGQITSEEMRRRVEWDKRWSWSFENYLNVFETCRELNIPLIALNVDSEDLGLVETGGFPALHREQIQKYIIDPSGFAEFAKTRYYKTYVDYVISPSYDLHKELGILRTTITGQRLEEDMPFTRFFSGRILWDEGMASNAYKWSMSNPGGLIIGLVGADHVKFEGGITGRYKRLANGQYDSISVILNPTLIDTRPSGSVSMATNSAASAVGDGASQISLQLRYLKEGVDMGTLESRKPESTAGVLPLADYIVLSQSPREV